LDLIGLSLTKLSLRKVNNIWAVYIFVVSRSGRNCGAARISHGHVFPLANF